MEHRTCPQCDIRSDLDEKECRNCGFIFDEEVEPKKEDKKEPDKKTTEKTDKPKSSAKSNSKRK